LIRSACIGISFPPARSVSAKGITAKVIRAKAIARNGARVK